MRFSLPFLLLVCLFAILTSCSKNNANPATLPGTWILSSSNGNTYELDSDIVSHDKVITVNAYTSFSPGGQVIFTGNQLVCDSIQFAALVAQNIVAYMFGAPVHTTIDTTVAYQYSTSTTGTFELISSDSIHFISGGIPGLGGYGAPIVDGAMYYLSGNTLTLTSHIYNNSVNGITSSAETGTIITTMIKQ